MKNITRMIQRAIAATGEPVSLLIENASPTGNLFSAALVDSAVGETMTFPNDWQLDLAAEGSTIEAAIAALDEMCAEALL